MLKRLLINNGFTSALLAKSMKAKGNHYNSLKKFLITSIDLGVSIKCPILFICTESDLYPKHNRWVNYNNVIKNISEKQHLFSVAFVVSSRCLEFDTVINQQRRLQNS